MERRRFVRDALGAAAAAAAVSCKLRAVSTDQLPPASSLQPTASSLKQSVTRWPFGRMTVEALAIEAKKLGLTSVELLDPEDWPAIQKHGLLCAMVNAPGDPRVRLTEGFNRVDFHARLVPQYLKLIDQTADAGFPNVICFSGNRNGISDEEGIANCAAGLAKIIPAAERRGVTVCMELLNSKVDHKDYQCDRTPWGVELAKRVNSPRFRLLYDIYHMQIMEGDVIRTIRDNQRWIGHYHTAGVPGRHELDETQELQYPAIMRAIKETGFTGYIGQEFIPVREPMVSLAQAVRLCDV